MHLHKALVKKKWPCYNSSHIHHIDNGSSWGLGFDLLKTPEQSPPVVRTGDSERNLSYTFVKPNVQGSQYGTVNDKLSAHHLLCVTFYNRSWKIILVYQYSIKSSSLFVPTAILFYLLKSHTFEECNFPLSSDRLKFCLSLLPVKYQLSQREFYDTTIMISHCVSLIASIVYLSPFHQKERSKGNKERKKKRRGGSLQLRGLLSFYLPASLTHPSCIPPTSY